MNRKASWLLLLLIFVIILPGCMTMTKWKIRKIKRKLQAVQVTAFVSPGCPPCEAAKKKLAEAGISVQYVVLNCYNRSLARKLRIKSVPLFIVHLPTGSIRTQDIDKVLLLCRQRSELCD